MNTPDLFELLDNRRKELGLSQVDLGRMILGEPSTSVMQNIRRGASPSAERLAQLCTALDLEFYVGPPRNRLMHQHFDDVAMIDRLSADPAHPKQVPFSTSWLRSRGLRPADLNVLDVTDSSMEPIVSSGDRVLVETLASKPVSGRMYAVLRKGGIQIRWVIAKRKSVTLVSESDDHPEERVEPADEPVFHEVRWLGHFLR